MPPTRRQPLNTAQRKALERLSHGTAVLERGVQLINERRFPVSDTTLSHSLDAAGSRESLEAYPATLEMFDTLVAVSKKRQESGDRAKQSLHDKSWDSATPHDRVRLFRLQRSAQERETAARIRQSFGNRDGATMTNSMSTTSLHLLAGGDSAPSRSPSRAVVTKRMAAAEQVCGTPGWWGAIRAPSPGRHSPNAAKPAAV